MSGGNRFQPSGSFGGPTVASARTCESMKPKIPQLTLSKKIINLQEGNGPGHRILKTAPNKLLCFRALKPTGKTSNIEDSSGSFDFEHKTENPLM